MSVNYEQAWKDLRKSIIDQITVKGEGIVYADDLKKVMDEMIYDYKD
jgi:hypothetical protein